LQATDFFDYRARICISQAMRFCQDEQFPMECGQRQWLDSVLQLVYGIIVSVCAQEKTGDFVCGKSRFVTQIYSGKENVTSIVHKL